MLKVCVFLADGFEEVEGLTVVDLLRRADVDVTMVSVMDKRKITGAHNITVEADKLLALIEGNFTQNLDKITYETWLQMQDIKKENASHSNGTSRDFVCFIRIC